MIISHTHKFIFIKSFKTAGTSIESILSTHCRDNDIVTPLNDYRHNRDEHNRLIQQAMNAEEYIQLNLPNLQHVDAVTIKSKVTPEVWNDYYKISIARNPWDRTVSNFYWKNRNDPRLNPKKKIFNYLGAPFNPLDDIRAFFCEFLKDDDSSSNDVFYTIDNRLCVDFVIRYENLLEGYTEVCEKLGLHVKELPRLKGGIRKDKYHYSQYYNEESKALVEERNKNDVLLFGYSFNE